jgi:hypothetical protein
MTQDRERSRQAFRRGEETGCVELACEAFGTPVRSGRRSSMHLSDEAIVAVAGAS